eukprot:Partr_v1_DN27456_c0_g1_i2_m71606 putative GTPase activating protein
MEASTTTGSVISLASDANSEVSDRRETHTREHTPREQALRSPVENPQSRPNSVFGRSTNRKTELLKQFSSVDDMSSKWIIKVESPVPRVINDDDKYIVEHYTPTSPYKVTEKVTVFPSSVVPHELDMMADEKGDPYIYQNYFYSHAHKNLLGTHPERGPVAVSIRKELDKRRGDSKNPAYLYRGILRVADGFQYVVKSDVDLNIGQKNKILSKVTTKDVVFALFPDLETTKLKEIDEPKLSTDLLTIEEKTVETHFKFGVVYCKAGQTKEQDMLGNEHGSDLFVQFMDCIGDRVQLKGFKGYRGGLDTKEDMTGTHSYSGFYRGMNVMFHVSTMLPYSEQNKQQIQRKAHIGNDVGIIVFKEAGDSPNPFVPSCIVSQFPHVFMVVEEVKEAKRRGTPKVRVAVARKDDVPGFGPYPPHMGYFEMNDTLREFILAKMINGENAAFKGTKFTMLRSRTRRALLEDLNKTYLRSSTIGSTASLGTWRSLFGTADGLAGQHQKPVQQSNEEATNLKRSLSSDLKPKRTSTTPEYSGTRRTSSPAPVTFSPGPSARTSAIPPNLATIPGSDMPSKSPLLAQTQHDDQDNAGKTSNRPDSYANFFSEAGAQSIETDSPVRSGTADSALKSRLDDRARDYIDNLVLQQNELRLRIELKETQIKLTKAMAYIESLRNDGAKVIKELQP